MSMPEFPKVLPPIKHEDALNMILESIALEELGLSHIIKAESEKIQYILGTLPGVGTPCKPSAEEVIAVNKSVKCLLDAVMQNQLILKSKMESVLCAIGEHCPHPPKPPHPPCPPGPVGPTGPAGPPGSPGCIRAAAYDGCQCQTWHSGNPLKWQHSHRSCGCGCSPYLSQDGRKIILVPGKRYSVSFTLNICCENSCEKCISIAVTLSRSAKKRDKFRYHFPCSCKDSPTTVSAAGIHVSADDSCFSGELMLTLVCPESVVVTQSSISVIEV